MNSVSKLNELIINPLNGRIKHTCERTHHPWHWFIDAVDWWWVGKWSSVWWTFKQTKVLFSFHFHSFRSSLSLYSLFSPITYWTFANGSIDFVTLEIVFKCLSKQFKDLSSSQFSSFQLWICKNDMFFLLILFCVFYFYVFYSLFCSVLYFVLLFTSFSMYNHIKNTLTLTTLTTDNTKTEYTNINKRFSWKEKKLHCKSALHTYIDSPLQSRTSYFLNFLSENQLLSIKHCI